MSDAVPTLLNDERKYIRFVHPTLPIFAFMPLPDYY